MYDDNSKLLYDNFHYNTGLAAMIFLYTGV